MKYAKINALLHQQRIDAQDRRQMEEHIQRIQHEQPSRYNTAGEPLVVPSSALAPILIQWKERYDLEHDMIYERGGSINRDKTQAFGPMQYLNFHSGVPIRRIYGIMRQESKHVTLHIAERMLMAIDREYLLANGEIPVVPNPYWKMETWVAYMNKRGCSSDL